MAREKYGALGTVINTIFIKVPWFVFAGIFCLVIVVVGLSGFLDAKHVTYEQYVAGQIIAIPLLILMFYGALGLDLKIVSKALGTNDLVRLADRLFYEPPVLPIPYLDGPYRFFIVVIFLSLVLFGATLSAVSFIFYGTGPSASGSSGMDFGAARLFIVGALLMVCVMFLVVTLYGMIAIPVRAILHSSQWCPSCGKLFAMKRTDSAGEGQTTAKAKICKHCGHTRSA